MSSTIIGSTHPHRRADDDEEHDIDSTWILGDQLSHQNPALDDASPADTRVVMIESRGALEGHRYHRQRLHLVVGSMRRFAAELRDRGFTLDYRTADSYRVGLAQHRNEFRPGRVRVMEPTSWDMRSLVETLDVDIVRSNQFLCHYEDFATWASGRTRLVMEDFYRWQRVRLGYLMDGDLPAGGAWNYDAANRERPDPLDEDWPQPARFGLTDLDRGILEGLPADSVGAEPDGTWATSRDEALVRLDEFVRYRLPRFGPHQDAMLSGRWSMRHSLLSPYLNLGLLHPAEVCDAAEAAYRAGDVPIESAEGFIRQVIGWREYVWGVYWLWMPGYRDMNVLGSDMPLPPAFSDGVTHMRCLATTLRSVHEHGYAHHIQRLMVLANLALIAGIDPQAMVRWMRTQFVDGGDWVMQPNVLGMGVYADGGMMATKPYAAGGNYISRMSDYCGGCRYDPKQRTGPDACPYTTLYWDFLDRNADILAGNHRMARQLASARRLSDMPDVRTRAVEVRGLLARGEL